MARTDLKLKAKDQSTGNTTTTSITHVNENADSATLLQFSQMLNNLTTNTYDSTDRVQTINVDTEQVPVTPTETELTLNVTSGYSISSNSVKIPFSNFTYTGNGDIKQMFGIGVKQGQIGGAFAILPGTDSISFSASSSGTYNLQLALKGANSFEDIVLYTTVTVN